MEDHKLMAEESKFKTWFGKYFYILGIVTLLGGGGLFAYLHEAGLEVWCEEVIITEVDKLSNMSCTIYNPEYKSKYLMNHENWPVTFSPDIVDAKVYAKYYGKWRYTEFTRETRFPNIKSDAKYVFAFPARTKKYFQIRINVTEPAVIKWDFGTLDPVIISWEYIKKNYTRQEPVYENVTIEIDSKYSVVNDTWSTAYNYTYRNLTRYKDVTYTKDDSGILHRAGVKVGSDIYLGWYSICGTELIHHKINPGDRNEREYCECRPYEIEKGVCTQVNITS